jgi:hypothetical protein
MGKVPGAGPVPAAREGGGAADRGGVPAGCCCSLFASGIVKISNLRTESKRGDDDERTAGV